ncbi:4'-phosphopantetheinyl transferase family protein [Streptomyces sp. NPDC090022]|uniref:4'-phosphopantetheinyl transferase family protein n=1 Tax=Streptomyces sp. NPDC090022 TaxID=3365920 RepID=UPI003813E9ED
MKSEQARTEFVTCRAAVRRVLSGLLDVPATDIALGRTPCPGCGAADHGPPAVRFPVTPWRISIAHTAGLGLLALSPFRVGVDVERLRPLDVAEIGGPVLSGAERRELRALPYGTARTTGFLRCWTRKEAVLKAVGVGITADLTALETRFWEQGPAHVATTGPGSPATWRVADVPVPQGWIASLALPAGADRPLSVRPL